MGLRMIFDSLINGQRRQMVAQIDAYGTYDFWEDFANYLKENCDIEQAYDFFTDATWSYHRVKSKEKK
jgi:hypothetical protein